MRARRRARILALKSLYEADMVGHNVERVLERFIVEKPLPSEISLYAQVLIRGVMEKKEKIDEIIGRFAPQFPVKEISPIDRNILRLAIYEILFNNKVPMKAAINEAVELAKTFGSESSPRFVNGVLGSVSHLVEGEKKRYLT